MFKDSSEVLKFIKDEDVKFLDIRFTDLPGVQQHFNIPASPSMKSSSRSASCSTAPRSAGSRTSTNRTCS
jgi:glutamine synthetase